MRSEYTSGHHLNKKKKKTYTSWFRINNVILTTHYCLCYSMWDLIHMWILQLFLSIGRLRLLKILIRWKGWKAERNKIRHFWYLTSKVAKWGYCNTLDLLRGIHYNNMNKTDKDQLIFNLHSIVCVKAFFQTARVVTDHLPNKGRLPRWRWPRKPAGSFRCLCQ